jgi:integrase/recombinase XerD
MGGDTTMSDTTPPLGVVLHSFFVDHLITVKGLRPASVRSYRDTIRLLLTFVAADKGCRITRLTLGDLSFERMVSFLRYLEVDRHNHVRTRNQRLAAIHALFDYIATRSPEMLGVCQRVAAIPMKRSAPAETRFLERDEVEQLLRQLPADGRLALRDRAILLFLYNTGARGARGGRPARRTPRPRRAPRGAPARQGRQVAHLPHVAPDRGAAALPPRRQPCASPGAPVFAANGHALTRFGIYKVVRRHASNLDNPRVGRKVSPHIFRHTAAVHLLEAGVEVNVIRGWLGHADLTTTNRYAEINTRAKLAALRATEPPGSSAGPRVTPVWRSDKAVLDWLASL